MFSWLGNGRKSDYWYAQSNHKTWRMRNHPINISDTHILYATDCNVGENGIVLYDIENDKFDITKYPPQMTPEYHSYCKHQEDIYIFEPSGSIIRFSLRSRKFQYIPNTKNRHRIGRYSACINIEDGDEIHVFGGLDNQYHLKYSISNNTYTKGTDFGVKLENPNIMYLESTRQLLMFSGYANTSYFVGTLTQHGVEWKISEHLVVPNKLRDCGQILYRDHLVIFGGMGANTLYSNQVWLLSVREHDFGKLTPLNGVLCPAKDKYFSVLVGDRVHLFGLWNNVKHHAISTEVLDRHIKAPLLPKLPKIKPLAAARVPPKIVPNNLPDIPDEDDEKMGNLEPMNSPGMANGLASEDPVFADLRSQIEERDHRISELEEENQALRALVAQFQRMRPRLDSMCYQKWSADQIASWISKLDNGRFAALYQKLADNLQEDVIEGKDLKDINQHKHWKRYGVSKFKDRQVLMQHVADLIDNDMYRQEPWEADGDAVTPHAQVHVATPKSAMDENDQDLVPGTFEEGQVGPLTGGGQAPSYAMSPRQRRMTPYF